MNIYITYCSGSKDNSLAGTGRKVTPDQLYASGRIQEFVNQCRSVGVRWAIFSDHYGVWFSDEEREWYGDDVGDPNRVTDEKYRMLVQDFDSKLASFEKILFYYRTDTFHPLHRRLVADSRHKDRITLTTELEAIRQNV